MNDNNSELSIREAKRAAIDQMLALCVKASEANYSARVAYYAGKDAEAYVVYHKAVRRFQKVNKAYNELVKAYWAEEVKGND